VLHQESWQNIKRGINSSRLTIVIVALHLKATFDGGEVLVEFSLIGGRRMIKVIDEKPPVYVTTSDLAKYKEEYARFMMHYCGNLTLEDYIRRQQKAKDFDRRS
jgi:hypothetical protein